MTQCAVEERRNLELAIRGLVTYAETLSIYAYKTLFQSLEFGYGSALAVSVFVLVALVALTYLFLLRRVLA